jgi:hypothetical protein
MPEETDKKLGAADAEPSEAKAAAGDPARRPDRSGSAG